MERTPPKIKRSQRLMERAVANNLTADADASSGIDCWAESTVSHSSAVSAAPVLAVSATQLSATEAAPAHAASAAQSFSASAAPTSTGSAAQVLAFSATPASATSAAKSIAAGAATALTDTASPLVTAYATPSCAAPPPAAPTSVPPLLAAPSYAAPPFAVTASATPSYTVQPPAAPTSMPPLLAAPSYAAPLFAVTASATPSYTVPLPAAPTSMPPLLATPSHAASLFALSSSATPSLAVPSFNTQSSAYAIDVSQVHAATAVRTSPVAPPSNAETEMTNSAGSAARPETAQLELMVRSMQIQMEALQNELREAYASRNVQRYPTTTPSPINARCTEANSYFRPMLPSVPVVNSATAQYAHPIPPRKLVDLPQFSGQPEDWPAFYMAFTESTAAYGYSKFENNQRLHKSLTGEARETVKSLLIHPNNVNDLIEQLRIRFGRPDQLIRSQLNQVREIVPIPEHAIARIVPFAIKVKNLTAFLATAGGQQHLANPILLEELVAKLPMSRKVEWARHAASIQPYPSVDNFSDWLNDLANVICVVQSNEVREPKKRAVLHTSESQKDSSRCPICQSSHTTIKCERFNKAPVSERWNLAKRARLCFTCLRTGHASRDCRIRTRCSIDGCARRHHVLLHEPLPRKAPVAQPTSSTARQTNHQPTPEEAVFTCATRTANDTKLLFRVLPVTLYGPNRSLDTYALLDEGSSVTMLDESLLRDLGLQGEQCQLDVQWIGGRAAHESSTTVSLHISGLNMRRRYLLQNVFGIPALSLPTQTLTEEDVAGINPERWPVLLYRNAEPKILIGLDHCHLGVPIRGSKPEKVKPFVVKTKLGCVVFGQSPTRANPNRACMFTNAQAENSLQKLVAEYFELDSFGVRPSPPVLSKEDARARQILERTTKMIDGRFQTGLLWKEDSINMPDTYHMALNRLVQIEKKIKRDEAFAAMYNSVIESYISKDYARKLPLEEIAIRQPRNWFLPHFGVFNPNKPSKFRLVFDAAAEAEGKSLNSFLLKGPQNLRQLPAILFHFREGAVAVCADIKEMYHQVKVQPADRCAQRFLWRNGDANRTPDIYEMSVMTFGAACSPCAAEHVKTVNALNQRCQQNERAVKAILERHYVDDYVDSFDTVEQAVDVAKKVRAIHASGGFELRGFTSNSSHVVESLEGEPKTLQFCGSEGLPSEKILGMYWQPTSDCFNYNLRFHRVKADIISGHRRPTKRELLSVVMSIFDPLGFLSHFTICAKILMREVWRCQIRWDEAVPNGIFKLWDRWRKRLSEVVNFRVPRFYFYKGPPINLQLHVFVDASEEAFAAAAYWRYGASAKVGVSLICAKTRCAPLRRMTTPRLELQAAVLGCRLAKTIMEEHGIKQQKLIMWTDSSTVVRWITSKNRRYKPFVAHRIAEVLDSTSESNWRWIPTAENVADEATRWNDHAHLEPSSRWLQGPDFLLMSEATWPVANEVCRQLEADEEEIGHRCVLVVVSNNLIQFNRFSSFRRLVRTVAWVIRFTHSCRRIKENSSPHGLTARELEAAEMLVCRIVQNDGFADELKATKNGNPVSRGSQLYHLTPYIDDEGLLRVDGRIDAASWLPLSVRRPIILPPEHRFTMLVVLHYHQMAKHQNSEMVICEVRRKYWIPRLRNLLRKVQASCGICKISRAQPRQPIMGPLPADRLTPYVRPFTYTGLDYFGPVLVTIGRRHEKRWIALFTCLTIRAVHLEVAHDLSTDACIVVIRNFINRRGVPVRMRSDNGTNFVGANNEAVKFEDVFECGRLQDELTSRGVEWLFSSPANPSEGGVWERMVQSVKRVLRHTLKEVAPQEYALQCFVIEAENVINSRPLTHLPVDPADSEPLTPNHFLLGSANTARTPGVPEPNTNPRHLRKQ